MRVIIGSLISIIVQCIVIWKFGPRAFSYRPSTGGAVSLYDLLIADDLGFVSPHRKPSVAAPLDSDDADERRFGCMDVAFAAPTPSGDVHDGGAASAGKLLRSQMRSGGSRAQLRLRNLGRDQWIYMIGDSTIRDLFYDLTAILQRQSVGGGASKPLSDNERAARYAVRHTPLTTVRVGLTTISYSWQPFIDDVNAHFTGMWNKRSTGGNQPTAYILGAGLWDLLYRDNTTTATATSPDADSLTAMSARALAQRLASVLPSPQAHSVDSFRPPNYDPLNTRTFVMWKSMSSLTDQSLSGHRANSTQFRDGVVARLNTVINRQFDEIVTSPRFLSVDGYSLSHNRAPEWNDDGVHSVSSSQETAAAFAVALTCVFSEPVFLSVGQVTFFVVTLLILTVAGCGELGRFVYTSPHCFGDRDSNDYASLPNSDVELIPLTARDSSERAPLNGSAKSNGSESKHSAAAVVAATPATPSAVAVIPSTPATPNPAPDMKTDPIAAAMNGDSNAVTPPISLPSATIDIPAAATTASPATPATATPTSNKPTPVSSTTPATAIAVTAPTTPATARPVSAATPAAGASASNERASDAFNRYHSIPSPLSRYYGSTRATIQALAWTGLIIGVCYVLDGNADRWSWTMTADKKYVRDTFMFVCAVVVVLGALSVGDTFKKNNKLLNRDQTDEWKGYMQIAFVLYHYFHAEEIYNTIRVLIASYVWLTGFGNFSFFYVKKDYSFNRLAKMMFRLNFLVILICTAMNREWMLYYICPLHTMIFLSVYAALGIWQSGNYANGTLFVKACVYFGVFVLVFDVPKSWGTFDALFGFGSLFTLKGSLYEWRFRSTLDHFGGLTGMICAYLHPWTERKLDAIETLTPRRQLYIKSGIVAVCLFLMGLWVNFVLLLPKYTYNAQHPYTSILPILLWLIIRNIHPLLRGKVMTLFAWCGKITLETYIFQFHLWLSDDAGSLLSWLTPGAYPLINFCLATIIYVFFSYSFFRLTNILSDAFIPSDADALTVCRRILVVLSGWVSVYGVIYGFASAPPSA